MIEIVGKIYVKLFMFIKYLIFLGLFFFFLVCKSELYLLYIWIIKWNLIGSDFVRIYDLDVFI